MVWLLVSGGAYGLGVQVRCLARADVVLVGHIDRSERVDVEYEVIDGQLRERPVTFEEIPAWDPTGSGPHSVAHMIEFCASVVDAGGTLLGAFEGEELLGVAVVHPTFEAGLAWLAFLHVSRPHRRRGAASALWEEAVELAHGARAHALYVSATPTGSAVGFYLAHGCRLADPVHPALFADEPDDIHLVVSLD